MSRLITFGCSYTFGNGLPDCDKNTPSKLAWPSVLGKHMNKDVVNVSVGGASNFEILYNILNFNFQEQDTVVIMWTHYHRDTFFKKLFFSKGPINRLGSWSGGSLSNKWIENMNDKTFIIKTWTYMHHADLYLKTKKVKYIHFPARYEELSIYKQEFIIDNLYTNGLKTVDHCKDGHPGIESNKQTAEIIYKILNEQQ